MRMVLIRGWLMVWPPPVEKMSTWEPPAAMPVMDSPPWPGVSITWSPLLRFARFAHGITSTMGAEPAFWMAPSDFSSIVVRPPSMLSPVGWLPLKSTPQARMRSSISSTILQMRLPRAGRTHLSASTPSPPIISVVSAKSARPPCLTTWSVTQPVALLWERPEVVSDVPQLSPNRSLLIGTSCRRSFVSSLSISMPMRVALAVASIAPPSSRMLIASTRFPVLAISWAISSAVQPSSRW